MDESGFCGSSDTRRPDGAIEEAWARTTICRFDVGCGWIGIASRCAVEDEAAGLVFEESKKNRPGMAGMDSDGISEADSLDDESHVVATAQEWLE